MNVKPTYSLRAIGALCAAVAVLPLLTACGFTDKTNEACSAMVRLSGPIHRVVKGAEGGGSIVVEVQSADGKYTTGLDDQLVVVTVDDEGRYGDPTTIYINDSPMAVGYGLPMLGEGMPVRVAATAGCEPVINQDTVRGVVIDAE